MARSIHETRRSLEEARRWEFADAAQRSEALWIVEDRLDRKRRYKSRTAAPASRHSEVPDEASWTVEVVVDAGAQHVHHPLSVADVGGLLASLPADVRPEVHSIRLTLGQRESDMAGDGTEPDPFTGRHGFPEGRIWSPRLRGRFRSTAAAIDLFAYVYDEGTISAPALLEPLLWLFQAQTLAHEVAHAWDATGRRGRDRWALDEGARGEDYAEESARRWLTQHAVPYFRRHHPERAEAFDAWVAAHLGTSIPLERFADDADRSLWGAAQGALELAASWSDARALDLRADFAEQMHFVDDFRTAKDVLRGVLAIDPDHEVAVTLMGDIAVHEDDWPAALEWTERSRRMFPASAAARMDRVDALAGAGLWHEALEEIGTSLSEIAPSDRSFHAHLRRERVRLALRHGLDDVLVDDVEWLRRNSTPIGRATADAVEAEWHLRNGRRPQAFAVAEAALMAARKPPGLWGAILRLVAWDAAPDRTKPTLPPPSEWDVDLLVGNGHGDWVERLRAEGMVVRAGRTRRQADLLRRRGPLVRL